MGNVTGGVRNTGSIDLSLPSLIGKGATILSPEISVNEGINPNVNIVPLEQGVHRGHLEGRDARRNQLFHQPGLGPGAHLRADGRGRSFPDGRVVFNHGNPTSDPHYEAFARMFAAADRFPIQEVGQQNQKVIRLSASDAVDVMKGGVGNGRRVKEIQPVRGNRGLVDVTIVSTPKAQLTGLKNWHQFAGRESRAEATPAQPELALVEISAMGRAGKGDPSVGRGNHLLPRRDAKMSLVRGRQLRRVDQGRVALLLALPRECVAAATLLRIDKASSDGPVPFRTFVQTDFNDRYYYLRRQADAGDSDVSRPCRCSTNSSRFRRARAPSPPARRSSRSAPNRISR